MVLFLPASALLELGGQFYWRVMYKDKQSVGLQWQREKSGDTYMDTVLLKKDLPELRGEITINHKKYQNDFAVIREFIHTSASQKVEYCAEVNSVQ